MLMNMHVKDLKYEYGLEIEYNLMAFDWNVEDYELEHDLNMIIVILLCEQRLVKCVQLWKLYTM